MNIPQIKLNDQTLMPQLGFGTWQLEQDQEVLKALDAAWSSGYKHIDTAQIYNNEYAIGQWLKTRKIKREAIYITTKVWVANFGSLATFKASVEASLKRLGVSQVNMLLLHWPVSPEHTIQAYQWLEEMQKLGYTKSIGVSNFNVEALKLILEHGHVKPAVNQIQFDIINQEKAVRDFCAQKNIKVQGYSLLKPYLNTSSQVNLKADEKAIIDNIALKYQKSAAQILLRFALDSNVIIFPKSKNPERIKANIDIFDFELSLKDFATLKNMNNQPVEIRMDKSFAEGAMDHMLAHPLVFGRKFKKSGDYWVNDENFQL